MLRNYIIITLRQLKKNKVFSFINLFGLALGMAATLVIAQYVRFHTSFDMFYTNADRIFRIEGEAFKQGTSVGTTLGTPDPLAETLVSESPFVEKRVRFFDLNYTNNTVIYESESKKVQLNQGGTYMVDGAFFDVFDVGFVAGSALSFSEPKKAVLTLSACQKYFEDPQTAPGSLFTLSGNTGDQLYQLVGVVDDPPKNSHFSYELLLSYPSIDLYTDSRNNWGNNGLISYLLLDNANAVQEVQQDMQQLYDDHISDLFAKSGFMVDYRLMNVKDIHLSSTKGAFKSGASRQTVYILSLIAVVILVIAWINYMNLSLIRTVERLKEMGVRKCMGSSIHQLVQLFLVEATVMNAIAFAGAFLFTKAAQQYLTTITGLPATAFEDFSVVFVLIGLVILGAVCIGLFPYALLKAMNIVQVLVGKKEHMGGVKLRKSLVFAQFMITFILLAGTVTVYKQVQFMREADLGINIDNILVIKAPAGNINSKKRQDVARFSTLKTELLKQASITEITNAGVVPGEFVSWGMNLTLQNAPEEQSVFTKLVSMDLDFPSFFGIDMVAGRALREGDSPWTKGDVVINEKLVQQLGFASAEDAIGAKLEGFNYGGTLVVRGVVENHHHTSLHDDFEPFAYILSSWTSYYFVKIRMDQSSATAPSEQLATTLTAIQKEWDHVFTDFQMDYFFLDEAFDAQYQEDLTFGQIFSTFSALAIIIACLGLFGLTSFTIQQRTKEIGIRKVLGASTENLMLMLSKEYVILVGAACVCSIPIARWIMSKWLEGYSFRIPIGWWFYVLPVVCVISLAFFSIIAKVVASIKQNPVESLRYE